METEAFVHDGITFSWASEAAGMPNGWDAIIADFQDGFRVVWIGSREVLDDPPMRPVVAQLARERRHEAEAQAA